jgi:hypothetical protein
MMASPGILGFPADDGRPLGPNAKFVLLNEKKRNRHEMNEPVGMMSQ